MNYVQEPRVHQEKRLGDEVHLHMDVLFMVKSSAKLMYEWYCDDCNIKDDHVYSGSKTNTLNIKCFECKYEGIYKCVVSTTQPILSMSTELQLCLHSKWCTLFYVLL